jgi:probable non-F420 flavinoid oxidoreductase
MVRIGYHASHEQFAPSALLRYVQLAEEAGFACAKSSDHFHPWSEKQGQSGFAWSWLGAAMQATRLPFGMISAPGYRYHPAVLAQAAATIGEMFPDRLWLALGSGEAINEAITGLPWPEKAERNARLAECIEITRALFAGETVTHRGRVTVIEAKLYSRPERPVPIYGAAVTEETARWVGSWADGLLTTGGRDAAGVAKVIDAFRAGGGEGKPVVLQAALCWAPTDDEATASAMDQWRACAVGGEVNWDLRRPHDFDMVGDAVKEEQLAEFVPISSNPAQHVDWIGALAALGVDEIHLHQVGRNQEQFIYAFGELVLPQLR